ncbi:serine/threonine protein kinase [Candidatus Uhrbacteria bacterium]|nr:serine/threonine protein kinase [Candidatus Uhrbacteria bacterium]
MSNGKGPVGNGLGSDPTLPASDAGAFTGSGITPLLFVGQIVEGRYRVLTALDHGGMGQVYKVEHLTLGSHHALKIYYPASGSTPAAQFAERFVEEARLLVAIRHGNVVSVTDAGAIEIGGVRHPFYVMELLEGQSLQRLLASGAIDSDRALAIIMQAAHALEAVHARGIIHRDLKPDNIFLTDSPEGDLVKVIDFGIAKVNRQGAARTQAGLIIGTPAYMAPEQAAGKIVDCRADVYSLGAVLYEMLTGEPPFGREDLLTIFHRQATQQPRPPHEVRAAVSEDVSSVALKAIARQPEERYASVEEFRAALSAFTQGGAVARAVTATDPYGWKGRKGLALLAGFALVFVFAVLLFIVLLQSSPSVPLVQPILPPSPPVTTVPVAAAAPSSPPPAATPEPVKTEKPAFKPVKRQRARQAASRQSAGQRVPAPPPAGGGKAAVFEAE